MATANHLHFQFGSVCFENQKQRQTGGPAEDELRKTCLENNSCNKRSRVCWTGWFLGRRCVYPSVSVHGSVFLAAGLHNHFQLSCVFDHLLRQLRGGNGHFFCPLVLTGESVAAVWVLSPAALKSKKHTAPVIWMLYSPCAKIPRRNRV